MSPLRPPPINSLFSSHEFLFFMMLAALPIDKTTLVKDVANQEGRAVANKLTQVLFCVFLGQNEIERACDLLFKKAESIDYRYEVHDRAVEGLLILPLYGSMSTGQSTKCP